MEDHLGAVANEEAPSPPPSSCPAAEMLGSRHDSEGLRSSGSAKRGRSSACQVDSMKDSRIYGDAEDGGGQAPLLNNEAGEEGEVVRQCVLYIR